MTNPSGGSWTPSDHCGFIPASSLNSPGDPGKGQGLGCIDSMIDWTRHAPQSWAAQRYLAGCYLKDDSTLELAERVALNSLNLAQKSGVHSAALGQMLCVLLQAQLRLGRVNRLAQNAEMWSRIETANPDPHYYQAFANCKRGDWNSCAKNAQRHMELSAKARALTGPVRPFVCGTLNLPCHALALFAVAASKMGQPDPAGRALAELVLLPGAQDQSQGFLTLAGRYGLQEAATYLSTELARLKPEWSLAPGTTDIGQAGEAERILQRGRDLVEQKRYDQAIAALESALAMNPEHPQVIGELGFAHNALEQYDQAAKYYERLVTLMPDQVAPLFNLAVVRAHLGQNQEAVDSLQRCLRVDPEFKQASDLLQRLSQA
jgi:tetratricopeptide (TPR) repeat protein